MQIDIFLILPQNIGVLIRIAIARQFYWVHIVFVDK